MARFVPRETQNGEIYIRHFVASGENYTRNKQYRDLRFWSEGKADYGSGTSVKFPDRTMVASLLTTGDHLTADFNAQSYAGRLEGALWWADALRRHPGAELPHARLHGDRVDPQRLCAHF
jgi:hypothetical protein